MSALSGDRDQAVFAAAPPQALVSRPLPVALAALGFSALTFASYPFGAGAVIAALMATVLVILTVTDLERRVIPNRIVLPAAAIVLVARVAFFPDRALEFIVAALGVAFVFLIPSLINRSLMGMGDVKLMLLLGAGLGWSVAGALALAFLSLFPVALAVVIRGGLSARKTTLPFGPFLAFGGIFVLLVPHLAGLGAS
ncbi:MAG TPA: A24 family peptidase [Solirubrobacteraceae bacterium]|jgi:prepilin signal peptidase PulO-like enzyme (type II secretory pathway)|nr:A24 family peptidase [Solirubrobacteraceae bacterium]